MNGEKYETEHMTIYWNAEICQHAAKCVHGSPGVFDSARKPRIIPENGTEEEIVNVIDRCSPAALRYEWKELL